MPLAPPDARIFLRFRVDCVVRRADLFASHLRKDAWLSPERFPANKPSTLISSSISSQCIPTPRPIDRQRLRSANDACINLGYHASGTEMLRPSLRSTQRVSFETVTFSTNGTSISTAEVLIPSLHKQYPMITHQSFDSSDLRARKTAAVLQPNRVQSKFCDPVITLNVYMLWFVTVTGIEKESIRSDLQNGGHSVLFPTTQASRFIQSSPATRATVCRNPSSDNFSPASTARTKTSPGCWRRRSP